MASMVTSSLPSSATSRHIQEALLGAGAEGYLIFGSLLPPRPVLRLKVSELLGLPPIPCAPMTRPDPSQVEMAERRPLASPAPAPDPFPVNELEAIRQLRLHTPELWVLVIACELVCKVGAVEEVARRPA
jgi:hypothetical protein